MLDSTTEEPETTERSESTTEGSDATTEGSDTTAEGSHTTAEGPTATSAPLEVTSGEADCELIYDTDGTTLLFQTKNYPTPHTRAFYCRIDLTSVSMSSEYYFPQCHNLDRLIQN